MLKKSIDFSSIEEYMTYTKSTEFLLQYSWEDKSHEEIIKDMALPDFEQVFLLEAIEVLKEGNDFSGMVLDRYILRKLDEQDEDEFNSNDVIFIERDD